MSEASEIMKRSIEVIAEAKADYERSGMSEEGVRMAASIMSLVATLQAMAIHAGVGPEFHEVLRRQSKLSARAFAAYAKKYEKIDTSLLSS